MNGNIIPATSRLMRCKITVSVSGSSNRSIQQHRQANSATQHNRTHEGRSERRQGLGYRFRVHRVYNLGLRGLTWSPANLDEGAVEHVVRHKAREVDEAGVDIEAEHGLPLQRAAALFEGTAVGDLAAAAQRRLDRGGRGQPRQRLQPARTIY